MSDTETTAQFLDRIGADGAKWAHEFKLTAEKLGHTGMDEGWLIGWFCNAIRAGQDAAHRRASQAAPAPSDRLVSVGKASGMVEARVSLAARQIRQSLRDYGHRCAETSLPDLIAADVDAALRKQDEIHAPAPSDGLREALEPFADFARASSFDRLPDDMPMTQGSRFARRQVTAGDFKRALAALSTPTEER